MTKKTALITLKKMKFLIYKLNKYKKKQKAIKTITKIISFTCLCFGMVESHHSQAFIFKKTIAPKTVNTISSSNTMTKQSKLHQELNAFKLPTKKINNYLISFQPQQDVMTIQNQYTFSAELKNISQVIVNNKTLQTASYLEYTVNLPSANIYPIEFNFITNDNQFFTKKIHITRLISPQNIQNYTQLTEAFVKLYNYLFSNIHHKPLNLPLNYQELTKLLNYNLNEAQSFNISYLDNRFSLQQPVTRLQFYIHLLNMLSITPSEYNHSPFKDILDDHWALPHLNTAINHGLLLPSEYFFPYKAISIGDALAILILHPHFRNITQLKRPTTNLNATNINKHEHLLSLLKQHNQKLSNHKVLTFKKLKQNQFYPTQSITIAGTIKPAMPFNINTTQIQPDPSGQFSYQYQLKSDHDALTVTAFGRTKQYKLFVASFYEDLSEHWLENLALKLQYLGLLEPSQKFNPQKTISSADYISLSTPFFNNNIPSKNEQLLLQDKVMLTKAEAISLIINQIKTPIITQPLPYWDIQKEYWAYDAISLAYALQIITKNTRFYPDRPITKAELISILAKIPHIKKKLLKYFHD